MQSINYSPVGSSTVQMAVSTVLTTNVPSTIRIYIRSYTSIATPITWITDNSLEQEVLSRAGLSEEGTLGTYTAVSSETLGDLYTYIVDVAVTF